MGILVAAAFAVRSTYQTTKGKSPGQLVFGRDMILPINHLADWRYIRQHKQTQIDNYVIWENTTRIDHDYRVGDKILIKDRSAYKYETPFKGLYEKFQTWTNGTINVQTGVVTYRINIRIIRPYIDKDI